ncbi:MAG TPA: hypothetical protein VF183_14685 [Acidimicrobiales bacterium]
MRYERLVIEADENTFTLDLHPRLTVIAGVGRLEREGLTNELIGALGSTRAGVHAEIVADNGARFALFRPVGGRHRVVSIDTETDVSDRFRNPQGEIDLLHRAGLDLRQAKRRMRLTPADLVTSSHGDEVIRRLAQVDSAELWAAAERVRITEDHLAAEAEAVGTQPEDAEIVQRIEDRHMAFVNAQARHERYRKLSFFAGAIAAIAAVPISLAAGKVAAAPLLIVAAVITAMSFLEYKRMEQAQAEEEEALKAAGAQSYLGFHLQRVNGLLASDQHRKRLMRAAEEHRASVAAWRELAGDVEVSWAFEHREAIDAAARLRRQLVTNTVGSEGSDIAIIDDSDGALAQALLSRLADVRTLGPGGESFPLILDDPLRELSPAQKPPLLELLVRASQGQQLIYLTEDEAVAAWARLEALTGELTVLEPAAMTEQRTSGTSTPAVA